MEATSTPQHIAIIMDGNGRWAKQRHLPRNMGHRAGVKAVRSSVEYCARNDIKYLTLFAFSSENWQRPQKEVGLLMDLFMSSLQKEVDDLHKNNVRVSFIGNHADLSPKLVEQMRRSERLTHSNQGLHLLIAIGYGGRDDLVAATRQLATQAQTGQLDPATIDEQMLTANVALKGLPDPDLFIRTGGERRISNFLLWNLAYTELYFADVLWPDFDKRELQRAVTWFAQRERRYGLITEQLS